MKKFAKQFALMMIIAGLGASTLVGCGKKPATEATEGTEQSTGESKNKYTTVIAATDDMNSVFNPLFYTTAYDKYVYQYTMDSTIVFDRVAQPVPSMCDFEVIENKDDAGNVATTTYSFTLKDGITFSDGEPVTADDLMFTFKAYCDPTYDGMGTMFTLPILGIKEYRYDDPDYAAKVAKLQEDSQNIAQTDIDKYITDYCTADYDSYGAEAIIEAIGGGVDVAGLDDAAKKEKVVAAYIAFETANNLEGHTQSAKDAKYAALEKEYIASNLASGEPKVPEIEGIKKVDDKTVQVTIEGIDPSAILKLAVEILPEHYYGADDKGNTFKKGDLSIARSRNGQPMGAGPYIFEKFENNVASFKANPNYFKGAPKTPAIKLQVADRATHLETVKSGTIDIAFPDATPQMLADVEAAGMQPELIENNGYGYIGINAARITDKNVRKGLMHLMNRKPAVDTYYGELATVIERPISKVSWASPQDAKEFYGFDPAKALEYFTKAGYTQVDKGGKPSLEKDGKQLKFEIGISDIANHPSGPILTQMKTEFEKLGGVLDIVDCDGTVFFDKLNAEQWDMWVAAWGQTPDPDMYQTHHSKGPTNRYNTTSAELDKYIEDARKTTDIEVRKELYAKALDIIMDEAVEMPVYQRKNMYIFNPEVVNIESLAKDPTPYYASFYDYTGAIETLELK